MGMQFDDDFAELVKLATSRKRPRPSPIKTEMMDLNFGEIYSLSVGPWDKNENILKFLGCMLQGVQDGCLLTTSMSPPMQVTGCTYVVRSDNELLASCSAFSDVWQLVILAPISDLVGLSHDSLYNLLCRIHESIEDKSSVLILLNDEYEDSTDPRILNTMKSATIYLGEYYPSQVQS